MKKFISILLVVLLMASGTVALAGAPSGAVPVDVGNFSDYSGGGSSGWSSGSDWGSSSDWDWDSGSSGSGFLSGLLVGSLGNSSGFVVVIVIVIIAALYIAARARRAKGSGGSPRPQQHAAAVEDHTDVIVAAVTAVDPLFSKDKFLGWAKEVFLTLQTAWMERDWEKVRPFEKEELFAQHKRQLQEYIDNGTINVMERINIHQAYLHKYERDTEYEYLSVYMEVRMIDYIRRADTGEVLKGDPNRDLYNKYIYKYMRKTGVQTDPATSNQSTVACPHCGAPTSITSAGKCEYCGFVVTTGEFDWVLCDITGVGPSTSVDNRGVVIH